ncbi:MAG: CotH kinase family protein [Saprospiraceae bacterium]
MKYFSILPLVLSCFLSRAQSFYDLNEIQEIRIYFAQNDWDYQMDTAKAGLESYLPADSVLVNGELFKNCGVKYKGNSSYDPGRPKNPLHIKLDWDKNNDYQGFTDIKLGNGWSDNAMIREPLCYAILRQYMDAPRGNFAHVFINDAYYGIMNNAESIEKKFLLPHFFSSRHAFVKCNPVSIGTGLGNGPNLSYLGNNAADYANKYELKSDSGWSELIQLCDTLNNHFDGFNQIADVDRFIWMLAFNNVLVNLDSYSGAFRQNYYLYQEHKRQWLPIVWDLNMCMGGFSVAGGIAGALTTTTMPTMSHTLHKSETGWPLINKLLNDPFYNKMYLAHLRTINNENFAAGQYKTLANELHNLVDQAVQNDTNYLSTYANFQASLSAHTPGSNGAGTSPGIFLLMDARANYLNNVLSAMPPVISNVSVANGDNFGETATINATVTNTTNVYLGFRYKKSDRFIRVPMYDDGAHGDGAAGDGVFGAQCPLFSLNVQYYIYAENTQTGAFSPERAEHEFYAIKPAITAAAPGEIFLNELTANNTDGLENEQGKIRDWIELYNATEQTLGLSQLYLTTTPANLGKWQFSEDAFIAPKERLLVWADNLNLDIVEQHTNFELSKSGESLYLSDGTNVYDEFTFGIQAENHSMSRCPDGLGAFSASSARTPRATNLCVSAAQNPNTAPDIRVLPNPAVQFLEIESAEPFLQACFYAADGRLCLVTGQKRVDVSALPSGIYWLKVIFPNERFVVRRVGKM